MRFVRRVFVVFLSIQAQDFIEDAQPTRRNAHARTFLSIQAQDFIEEKADYRVTETGELIPEHSSSGLH